MIPGHEGCGEGASLKPVQTLIVPFIAVPHAAEVSTHQENMENKELNARLREIAEERESILHQLGSLRQADERQAGPGRGC